MRFTGERFIPDAQGDLELAIEHYQRYETVVGQLTGLKVLDAACGEGYGSSILATRASEVWGLDIDEETIDHATQMYKLPHLHFVHGSVCELPFEDNSFDAIVSFETIEHISESMQRDFLREAKRVLKRSGILIVSTPNKAEYTDMRGVTNPFHVKEFYENEFRQFLNSYFAEVKLYYQGFQVASVLTGDNTNQLSIVARVDGFDPSKKYMLALCSNDIVETSTSFGSVVLDNTHLHAKLIQRISSLQDEVEERNTHLQKLDEEIAFLRNLVDTLRQGMDVASERIAALDRENRELKEKEEASTHRVTELENQMQRMSFDLAERDSKVRDLSVALDDIKGERADAQREIDGLNIKIHNQLGHIEQLLERERFLERILGSRGWHLLRVYYTMRDILVPENTWRRLFARTLVRFLRHPKSVSSHINKRNLTKFVRYARTNAPSQLEGRVENYLERFSADEHVDARPVLSHEAIPDRLDFPAVTHPMVSIVIPVYNQCQFTLGCLASILNNTDSIEYEVIVADDMSTDETTQIAERVSNVRVIRDGTNRGFLENCNNAARYAKGEYILFLNNDTTVQKNWLNALVDLIETSAHKVGMVGPKLVYPDGRLQEAGGIIWDDGSGWNYGRLDDPERPEYNYVKPVDYITGACIMIRADLWREIGGFDTRYVPAYFEDSDLAFEVRSRGYDVMFQPKSIVVHHEGISHGTDTSSGVKRYQLENQEKFVQKWVEVLGTQHFPNAQHVFHARDRSSNQKTILVVDHYVPHIDKDAGSRTVFQYLKLFTDRGFNVKFIGDNLYRHEPYTSMLQDQGIEVIYGKWYANKLKSWIRSNGTYFDYVLLNRPHISIEYIDMIREYTDAKILYYGHDLHYLREMREYELTGNEALEKSAWKWRATESELFEKADVVYYPSEVEIGFIRDEYPDVLARAIPAYILSCEGSEQSSIDFAKRSGLLFVGGFGHKPNTDAIVWFAKEIFPNLLRRDATMKLYVVGSNPTSEVMDLASQNVIITGFVTDEELESYYNLCRLVVVPLRFGAGVKGKVVEALHHRIPIVTTSVGAEGLPDADQYLTIVDDPEHFATEVLKLYHDLAELQRRSNMFSEYISTYFSAAAAEEVLKMDVQF